LIMYILKSISGADPGFQVSVFLEEAICYFIYVKFAVILGF
jgi:hypothetical protein